MRPLYLFVLVYRYSDTCDNLNATGGEASTRHFP